MNNAMRETRDYFMLLFRKQLVILDLSPVVQGVDDCVIIESLSPKPGSVRCCHCNPETDQRPRREKASYENGGNSRHYYKKIFRHSDLLDFGLLNILNMTAEQTFNPKCMRNLRSKIMKTNAELGNELTTKRGELSESLRREREKDKEIFDVKARLGLR